MTWTPDLVRIRFIEAADTERFLPRPFTATGKGYWPQTFYDEGDRAGWDAQAMADNAFKPASRAPLGAIAKHAECMDWTVTRIQDTMRRHLVWGYAFCRAHKREFGKLCDRRGWVKRTAYDRLNRLWERLSLEFRNESIPLREPSEMWLALESPSGANIAVELQYAVSAAPAIPYTPSFLTEKPSDLIRTQEDAEAFAQFLEQHNEAYRPERERREARRREKLGLIADSPA